MCDLKNFNKNSGAPYPVEIDTIAALFMLRYGCNIAGGGNNNHHMSPNQFMQPNFEVPVQDFGLLRFPLPPTPTPELSDQHIFSQVTANSMDECEYVSPNKYVKRRCSSPPSSPEIIRKRCVSSSDAYCDSSELSSPEKPLNLTTEKSYNDESIISSPVNGGYYHQQQELKVQAPNSPDSGLHSPPLVSPLGPPMPIPWSGGDPHAGLPIETIFEYDRLINVSNYYKTDYAERRVYENPIDCEYNPNKSRLRKDYSDPLEAAERAKNNVASRQSRIKKKIALQILKYEVEFDHNQNRNYFQQENWMSKVVNILEDKAFMSGLQDETLLSLRRESGFK